MVSAGFDQIHPCLFKVDLPENPLPVLDVFRRQAAQYTPWFIKNGIWVTEITNEHIMWSPHAFLMGHTQELKLYYLVVKTGYYH